MTCSTCSAVAPIGVRSSQELGARQVSWWQCFGCFNTEAESNARDREDDAKRAAVGKRRRA